MRIAIVVNSFPKISETFIFNKVIQLIKSGWDVTVIAHNKLNDEEYFQEQMQNIKVKRIYSNWNIGGISSYMILFLFIISNFMTVVKIMVRVQKMEGGANLNVLKKTLKLTPFYKQKFDIVHFEYTGLAIAYQDILSYLKPAKVFTSCRGAAEQIKPLVNTDRAKKLKRLFQQVDKVHCVSNDILNTCVNLYELNPEKAFVNRPAINTDKFMRSNATAKAYQNPFLFCSTGRLHWKKGFEYALLAMKELKQRGYFFRYEIIGGGVELEKLIFMVHDIGIQDCVSYCGTLPSTEIKSRLEKCDIFVLPSLSEGISNAVLEAMAMQVPVVSTRSGGMDEVVKNNDTGLLVDTYNAEQLANALEVLMLDESLRSRLAQNGCALVRAKFTIHHQIEIFDEQYKIAIQT